MATHAGDRLNFLSEEDARKYPVGENVFKSKDAIYSPPMSNKNKGRVLGNPLLL